MRGSLCYLSPLDLWARNMGSSAGTAEVWAEVGGSALGIGGPTALDSYGLEGYGLMVALPVHADTAAYVPQDFNQDGKADVVVRNPTTGKANIWLMDQAQLLAQPALAPLIQDPNWQLQASGNFNGDASSDLVWRNQRTGQNLVWLMNGTSPQQAIALPSVTDTDWEIRGVGDFDQDSQWDDLLWYDRQTGERLIWYLSGTNRQGTAMIEPNVDMTGRSLLGSGDFDGNGSWDLLWRDTTTGQARIWLMTGAQRSQELAIDVIPDLDWKLCGIGDYTADGRADLIWETESFGQSALWEMQGATRQAETLFYSDSPFNIEFDYRFDTQGWFTPERKAVLEAAARVWERIIVDEFAEVPAGTATPFVRNPETDETYLTSPGQASDIYVTDRAIDDVLVFVGTQSLGTGGTLGFAGASGFFSNETRYVGDDFEPWLGSLTFNRDANWFFDTTPATSNDIPFNQSDFLSTAVHELGHILGFSDQINAFAQYLVSNSFVGPNALAQNGGQPILLEDDHSHILDGYEFGGSGETVMDPVSVTGRRQLPTLLDLAILDDIGYEINYAAATQNASAS